MIDTIFLFFGIDLQILLSIREKVRRAQQGYKWSSAERRRRRKVGPPKLTPSWEDADGEAEKPEARGIG